MKYTKDGKIFETPIKMKKDGKVIFTNDHNLIITTGYKEYKEVVKEIKITLEEAIEASNEKINKETDEKILNEFTWNGVQFYLSMENQFNFKNLHDMRMTKEYPVIVKAKDGFMSLNDHREVRQFYMSGVQFIEECIKEGWERKAAAEEKIRKEYE